MKQLKRKRNLLEFRYHRIYKEIRLLDAFLAKKLTDKNFRKKEHKLILSFVKDKICSDEYNRRYKVLLYGGNKNHDEHVEALDKLHTAMASAKKQCLSIESEIYYKEIMESK